MPSFPHQAGRLLGSLDATSAADLPAVPTATVISEPAVKREPPVRLPPSIFNPDGSLNGEAITSLMHQLTTIKGRLLPDEAKLITQAQDVIRRHIGHK